MNKEYNYKDSISFDSDFECGNLDLVLQKNNNEYDLFMRVDYNTKGHFSWFFFKATSRLPQTAKFNICNFYKQHILYSKGMKPYIFNKSKSHDGWKQYEGNVTYTKNIKYSYPEAKPVYQLSFEY